MACQHGRDEGEGELNFALIAGLKSEYFSRKKSGISHL